jgi:hypothetical protein
MIASEKIIRRAATVWARLLEHPKFDNGDKSANGGLAFVLSVMANKNANNDKDTLDKFVDALTTIVMNTESGNEYQVRWLEVDYHPCVALANAATAAGLNIAVWPCKTSVQIFEDRVTVRDGYGAGAKNHYLLSDGGWLITDLDGDDDLKKIITMIEVDAKFASNFNVEHPKAAQTDQEIMDTLNMKKDIAKQLTST